MAETDQPATHTSADRQLASQLHSVVVHAGGALCRRRVSTVLPGGTAPLRVRVGGLPLTLDAYSLRGTLLSGPDRLRVLDVRREVEAELPPAEDLAPLRLACDEAEEAADAARAVRAALATQVEHVAALRAVPPTARRGDPPRQAPTESLLALAEFVDTRLAELQGRLRTAEDAERTALQRQDTARHRLQEASAALPTEAVRSTTTVVLTLDGAGPEPTACELEVEYRVPGATWTPSYHLRLEGIHGDRPGGSLVMRAAVAQRSGEDWTGVRLSLSTADLQRRTDLPELRSLRIGRRQSEPPAVPWREPPSGLSDLFTGYDAFFTAAAEPPLPESLLSEPVRRSTRGVSPSVVASADFAPLPVAPPMFGGGGPVPPPAPVPQAAPKPAVAPGGAAPGERLRSMSYGAAEAGPARSGAAPAPAAMAAPAFAAGPGSAVGAAFAAKKQHAQQRPVPPAPDESLRDYAQLALTGADGFGRERGQLHSCAASFDAMESELRRRAEAVAQLALPAHGVPVRASAGSFDHRYDTAAPVDVPADGVWHTVPVLEVPVELEPEHICVPAVDARVFAAVRLGNTGRHALLAGAAEVSVDGAHLMTVQLPTLAPGQHRRVGIGVVEGVQVARRVQMRESSAGLRGGTTVLQHGIEIDLANRLGRPVTVEVRERVPVGEDKDIRVDELPSSPPWTVVSAEQDEEHRRGMRVWRVTLEAHGSRRLSGGYEIRVPATKALFEGNRRL